MKTQLLQKPKKFKNTPQKSSKKQPGEQVVFVPKQHFQFPNIFRFITERFPKRAVAAKKIVFFLIALFVVAVAFISLDLFVTLAKTAYAKNQYTKLQQEKVYWQEVTSKYPGYKDADMHLALVFYALGEKEQAKLYTQKALQVDPNDTNAQTLAKQLEE